MTRTTLTRRRLLASAGAAALIGGVVVPDGGAATDDDLAFAHFGGAAELLLADLADRALASEGVDGRLRHDLRACRRSAREHGEAIALLLTDAGRTAPLADDFTFAWPDATFETSAGVARTGLAVTRAVLGAYLTAAVRAAPLSYRVLFGRMAANLGEQTVVYAIALGEPAIGNSFVPMLELEAASDLIEGYLG